MASTMPECSKFRGLRRLSTAMLPECDWPQSRSRYVEPENGSAMLRKIVCTDYVCASSVRIRANVS